MHRSTSSCPLPALTTSVRCRRTYRATYLSWTEGPSLCAQSPQHLSTRPPANSRTTRSIRAWAVCVISATISFYLKPVTVRGGSDLLLTCCELTTGGHVKGSD